MGTGQKVKKHQKPRSFSQASLRNLTKPKLEDIFISDPDIELDRKMLEEEEERKKILNHVFISGKKYLIKNTPKEGQNGAGGFLDYVFEYIKKDGIHHMFREVHGGWSRTYTAPQLIGKIIEEVD